MNKIKKAKSSGPSQRVLNDLRSLTQFNTLSLNYRYAQMNLSKMYQQLNQQKKPRTNVYIGKSNIKAPLFDKDIQKRNLIEKQAHNALKFKQKLKTIKIPFSNMKKIYSLDEIKQASRIFNKYVDDIEKSKKLGMKTIDMQNKSNQENNVDNNDDILEFLSNVNKELGKNKKHKITPTNEYNYNSSRNQYKHLTLLSNSNLSEYDSQHTFDPQYKLNKISSAKHLRRIFISFNNKVRTDAHINTNKKGKCNFKTEINYFKKHSSYININKMLNIPTVTEYNKINNMKKEITFNQLKIINKRMARLHAITQENEDLYKMKLTSSKIDFLQNNIRNMIDKQTELFVNKIDRIIYKKRLNSINIPLTNTVT